MLAPKEVLPVVAQIVSGNQFFDPDLGKLFTVCAYLSEANKPIENTRWLLGELPRHGIQDRVISDVLRLATQQPNWAHATYFAEQVRDTARLRDFITLGTRLLDKAYVGNAEPLDIAGWLDSQVLATRHGAQCGDELVGDVMQQVIGDFESRLHSDNKPVLLSSFPAADERGFVFAPGELTVLAARTSMGKTTLATQIGMYHAGKGRPVLMASLEMKATEIASRLLASAAGMNHQLLRRGEYDEISIKGMREAAEETGNIPFRLWAPGRVKVGQIHAMASMRKATHKIELLIVDLLQCVKQDDASDKEHVAFGKATKGLRDIAQQLQIPVLLLAQLNRGADNEVPRLTNLKGSGEIEQDADIVALLHSGKDQSEDVELIIAKNRFGAKGSVALKFIAAQTRFADPSTGTAWKY